MKEDTQNPINKTEKKIGYNSVSPSSSSHKSKAIVPMQEKMRNKTKDGIKKNASTFLHEAYEVLQYVNDIGDSCVFIYDLRHHQHCARRQMDATMTRHNSHVTHAAAYGDSINHTLIEASVIMRANSRSDSYTPHNISIALYLHSIRKYIKRV